MAGPPGGSGLGGRSYPVSRERSEGTGSEGQVGAWSLPPPAPPHGSRASEEPAINNDGRAGDVPSSLAGQEEGGADQLVGVGPAAERGSCRHLGLSLFTDHHRQVGQERPGGQAVD